MGFQYIMIAFIIVLVIALIVALNGAINTDNIKNLSKVSANHDDPIALRVANRLNPADLNPIDQLRLGGVYINNLGDIDRGQEINDDAALMIIDYPTFNIMDILTMQDLLNDNLARGFIDADLVLRANTRLQYDTKENINKIVSTAHAKLVDDPEAIQKTMLENIKWQSDAQNVHDEIITTQLRGQFTIVVNENMANCRVDNYLIVKGGMLRLCQHDHIDTLHTFFTELDKNYPTSFIADGVAEQDILLAVWNRSNDPRNKHNSDAIKKELITAAVNSIEKNVAVCITGRVERVWASLALLDVNPAIGILKSKQMIRNEILEKSAKIVSDAEEKLDDEIMKDYVAGEKNPRVTNYVESVRRDIAQMADQYGDAKNSDSVRASIELAMSLV